MIDSIYSKSTYICSGQCLMWVKFTLPVSVFVEKICIRHNPPRMHSLRDIVGRSRLLARKTFKFQARRRASLARRVSVDGSARGTRGRADMPRQAGKQHIYSYAWGVNHRASISSERQQAGAGYGQTPMPRRSGARRIPQRLAPRASSRGHAQP